MQIIEEEEKVWGEWHAKRTALQKQIGFGFDAKFVRSP